MLLLMLLLALNIYDIPIYVVIYQNRTEMAEISVAICGRQCMIRGYSE